MMFVTDPVVSTGPSAAPMFHPDRSPSIPDPCLVSDGLSDNVKQFIAECISSVEQLEVLLHLYGSAPRLWSAEAIAKDLYVAPESVQRRLVEFHEKGLLEKREEDLYAYKPVKQQTDRIVQEVAVAYKQRRVAVINQIFSNPQDHLRSFADAFKFKK
jgi:hypothetical protein